MTGKTANRLARDILAKRNELQQTGATNFELERFHKLQNDIGDLANICLWLIGEVEKNRANTDLKIEQHERDLRDIAKHTSVPFLRIGLDRKEIG
jgi:hypothetical protein